MPPIDLDSGRGRSLRVVVFLGVFLLVAGGGLVYDYSRPALYQATSRLSVEPPGVGDDPVAKAQFAVAEAQALRRSELMQVVFDRMKETVGTAEIDIGALERRMTAEALSQTSIIELRAEGMNRNQLVAALGAWMDAYIASRKVSDSQDESESVEEARHSARVAQKTVDDKRREMEAFRQRHGIVSIERDENPGTARLKGLHMALNDAATREVNAEAKLKAMNDSLEQGRGVVRAADKTAIAILEMRAVDLREKIKDLEHDYTAQYLTLDPKFKALKANLARVEQQVEQEKSRSQKAALVEAQEEFAGAQRAAQKIQQQAEALKQESQVFSTRFVELKRMAADLDQLQEARRLASDRLAKLESVRKPAAVKIRVLSAPSAAEDPISPDYSRDAGIALAAGLVLAIVAVWLMDYLRRDPDRPGEPAVQPIIQIAYPSIQHHAAGSPGNVSLPVGPAGLLGPASAGTAASELTADDVSALWVNAPPDGRLILAALFAGIAPGELAQLRWKHVHLDHGSIDVPGTSARRLRLVGPIREELATKAQPVEPEVEAPLLTDGEGNALDEAAIDGQLVCIAHDAGLRHPEEVTGRALHFTYAAFLARQGIRMSDLAAMVGRFTGTVGAELMRLAPPGQARSADHVNFVYPSFRPA